jgi:hypothetical protein
MEELSLSPGKTNDFSLLQSDRTSTVVPPASHSIGTGGFYTGAKRPGREADHLSPTAVDVRNEWSYSVDVCICVMQRDNFTLNSMDDVLALFGRYEASIGG